jgi:tetratricopeptide (TPR) repeat protein
MKCIKCGHDIPAGNDRCNACGESVTRIQTAVNKAVTQHQENAGSAKDATPTTAKAAKKNGWIGSIIFFVIVAAGAIFNYSNDKAQEQNQAALQNLESGSNYQAAIDQFETAAATATDDAAKVEILKNAAYAYMMNGQVDLSKAKFKEALALVKNDDFNFNLISGEIALLDSQAQTALDFYNKAYQKNPTDFQINSTLGVFYLGVDELSAPFTDFDKALTYNLAAYNDNPTSETMMENLAWNYFYKEDYSSAIPLLLKTTLANKAPNNYLLGLCYYATNDDVNAKIYLQAAADKGYQLEPELTKFLAGEETIE